MTVPDSASLHLSTRDDARGVGQPRVGANAWQDVIYKGNDNYYLEATSTHGGRPAGGGIIGGGYGEAYGAAALPANTWTHLAPPTTDRPCACT